MAEIPDQNIILILELLCKEYRDPSNRSLLNGFGMAVATLYSIPYYQLMREVSKITLDTSNPRSWPIKLFEYLENFN